MKDFTLSSRDFEIKLCKCGLLALVLIRTVLFKPVFLQDQPYRWNGIRVNCRHSYVGSISMKDSTLPGRDFEIKLCKCGFLALILIRTVLFKPVFSKTKPYRWNRIRVNCRHSYVGSISMKDFTLPRRDVQKKLCKCGLLALILIRTVLFKPVFSKIKLYRWNRIRVDCRHWYVGSISMKDFTLSRRDFEIKLCKCGLLVLILFRTVLFKPVFSKTEPYRWNRFRVNCRHSFVGSISMKDFTLSRRDFEIKLCQCELLALILIRTVFFKPVFLQDQGISLESAASQL